MVAQFEKLDRLQTHILLSATDQRKLIGSVMGIVCEELYGDCRPFLVIENMIVDREYRKSGIGKALLKELEDRAKQRNCTRMILVTETDRADACAFYEACGFHPSSAKGFKKKIHY